MKNMKLLYSLISSNRSFRDHLLHTAPVWKNMAHEFQSAGLRFIERIASGTEFPDLGITVPAAMPGGKDLEHFNLS